MVTTYACHARGSVLYRRVVTRRRGWPRGMNGNGLVECNGKRYVLPLRACVVMWRDPC